MFSYTYYVPIIMIADFGFVIAECFYLLLLKLQYNPQSEIRNPQFIQGLFKQ